MAMVYYLWPMWALLCMSATETAAREIRRRQADTADDKYGTGYRRYHANDSYIGKPIPCTDDEKVCFMYNLLLDTASDTCQPIGEGLFSGCQLRVNSTEYLERSGRVVGICRQYEDPCTGYRMAYDNRCYTKDVVENIICGCDSALTLNILGNWECRCKSASQIDIQQPKEAGRCKIPDFNFPADRSCFLKSDLESKKFSNNSCSSEQRKCFSEGKVWVAKAAGCYTLLDQGPCADDEVVILTKTEWVSGPAVCRQIRGGCPPGRILMAFDAKCHSEREMRISAPGAPVLNIIGEYDVMDYQTRYTYIPESQVGDTCGFSITAVGGAPPIYVPKPLICTGDLCHVYDLPPEPEYDHDV